MHIRRQQRFSNSASSSCAVEFNIEYARTKALSFSIELLHQLVPPQNNGPKEELPLYMCATPLLASVSPIPAIAAIPARLQNGLYALTCSAKMLSKYPMQSFDFLRSTPTCTKRTLHVVRVQSAPLVNTTRNEASRTAGAI
jgi:hypothetical protein